MVIRWDIFKHNQMTLFACFTFIPKTGVSFSCARQEISAVFMNIHEKNI